MIQLVEKEKVKNYKIFILILINNEHLNLIYINLKIKKLALNQKIVNFKM